MTKRYVYSLISAENAAESIKQQYDIDNISECVFFAPGLHDNFLVTTPEKKYMLRVYRHHWRPVEEALFELELLDFLRQQNQPVSYPLRTRQHELTFTFNCVEGERLAALFTYAAGENPGKTLLPEQTEQLGKTVAKLHLAGNDFNSNHQKPALDFDFLVSRSLDLIDPYLNPDQKEHLKPITDKIKREMSELDKHKANYGICMGDVNLSNFHIDEQDGFTLFDFDQCGFGFRAFEIGKFFSSLHSLPNKEVLQAAFLTGYEKVSPLSEMEKTVLPYFEIASHLWVMSIRVMNKDKIGYLYLTPSYWHQKMEIIESIAGSAE